MPEIISDCEKQDHLRAATHPPCPISTLGYLLAGRSGSIPRRNEASAKQLRPKPGSGKGKEKATVKNIEKFEFILTINWLNV